jgi:hypothetical protein
VGWRYGPAELGNVTEHGSTGAADDGEGDAP